MNITSKNTLAEVLWDKKFGGLKPSALGDTLRDRGIVKGKKEFRK